MMDCISYRIMTLPAKASSGLLLTSGIGGRALPGRDFDTACRRAPHSLRAPGSCALRRARQPVGHHQGQSLRDPGRCRPFSRRRDRNDSGCQSGERRGLKHAPTEHVGACVYIIYSGGLQSWSCHRCSSSSGTCSNATEPSSDPALVSLKPPNCAVGPYAAVTTTSASGVKSIPMTSS